jgi:hypothetical protein
VSDEKPIADVLEQDQELGQGGTEPELPVEANPTDVAEQWRPVGDPEDPDEEERDYG